MNTDLPKKWTFNYHQEKKNVVFNGEIVRIEEGEGRPSIQVIKRADFFNNRKGPIGILTKIDTEIMQSAISLIHPTELKDKRANKVFQFWKHLDTTKIKDQIFGLPNYKNLSLHLSSSGALEIHLYQKEDEYIYNQIPLDILFFDGPIQVSLSLEDRISIRKHILKAIHADSGLTLKDAFPLFDYSKLESKEWKVEKQNSELQEEEIVSLSKNGTIWRGIWEFWEGRIGENLTVEHIWKNKSKFRPKKHFRDAYKEIYAQLQEAIIEE